MDGKRIYEQAFKVIDYCGDIEKNRGYSEYFSPNNIRRLVISPNTVTSKFYIKVPDVGTQKIINIQAGILQQHENREDYVPIVQIISTERICSSIEEIIFVTHSNDGQIQLGSKEYAFESLIRNFNNNSGDVLETIKKRYVRLRDIVIFRGSYQQYIQIITSSGVKELMLISDLDAIKSNSDIKYIHTEDDWFMHWGSHAAAKTYPLMDGVDGHLWKYFEAYKTRMQEKIKKDSIDAFKKEKYGTLEAECKEEFDKFRKLFKMTNRLQKYIDKYGFTANLQYTWKRYPLPQLYNCSLLGDYPNQIDLNGGNEGDIYKKNKEIILKGISALVQNLSENYIEALLRLNTCCPDTSKVLLRGRDEAIIVPDSLSIDVASLEADTGCKITGSKLNTSAINVCWLTSLLLLNKSADDFNSKITTREYWQEALK